MRNWWKFLAAALVLYSIIGGFLFSVPRLAILNETVRNLYFHVPMWFAMFAMMTGSLVTSIRFLSSNDLRFDTYASEATKTALVFGIAGVITGALWAKFTWGDWWTNDVKLNGTVVSMLIYCAYLILRGSIEDPQKKARVASVYSIFAFVMLIVFVWILPRMNTVDSLHPGNGGNPGFNVYDLDNNMRLIFYPAVLGWILTGYWIIQLRFRLARIKEEKILSGPAKDVIDAEAV